MKLIVFFIGNWGWLDEGKRDEVEFHRGAVAAQGQLHVHRQRRALRHELRLQQPGERIGRPRVSVVFRQVFYN